MRIPSVMILAVGMVAAGIAAGVPAQAQTYGTHAPVCLQIFGPVGYYECRYSTIAQCNQSAAGRSAQCVVNPYLANASGDQPARRRPAY